MPSFLRTLPLALVWLLASLLAASGPAWAQEVDWTGDWQTYWRDGLANMTLTQTSDGRVTGTYQPDNGRIEGEVDGHVLRGTWAEEAGSGGFVFALSEDGQTFTGRFENGEYWNGSRAERAVAFDGPPLRRDTPEQALRALLIRGNAAIHAGDAAALREAERLLVYERAAEDGTDPANHDSRRRLLWDIFNLATFRLVQAPDGPAEPDGETASFRIGPVQSDATYTLRFRRDRFGWRVVVDPLPALEQARGRFLDALGHASVGAFNIANPTSPRQAMRDFLFATSRWDDGGREEALGVMDLSAIPERLRPVEGELLADYLWAVINRVGYVVWQELPNLTTQDEPFVFYSHPAGDVVIDRSTDPESEAPVWRFTDETLATIPQVYLAMQSLPVAEGLEGHSPLSDFFRLRETIRDAAPALMQRVFALELWQWLGLAATVLAAAVLAWVAGRLVPALLLPAFRALDPDPGAVDTGRLGPPARVFTFLLLLALAYSRLGLGQAGLTGRLLAVAVVLAGALLVYRLVGCAGATFMRQASQSRSHVDEIVTSLGLGLTKLVVIIMAIILAADVVGLPYEGVLTGLGIGGVALAFAARDTVSNLLGGAILLADRPFKRGDMIEAAGQLATIEEVGLRSTRLRSLDDTLLVVPNSQLSDQAIANWGSRRMRKTQMTISLTYDTPPDKLDRFVTDLAKVYRDQDRTDSETFYVGVKGFAASSIDVDLWGYFKVYTYDAQVQAQHQLVLDIVRLAERLGVSFAFPTRTVHVAPGPSGEGQGALAPPQGQAAE